MNNRLSGLFWFLVAASLLTTPALAQTITPTPSPAPAASPTPLPQVIAVYPPLGDIYGESIVHHEDSFGDVVACQNPAAGASDQPSDISGLEIYAVPQDVASMSGWLVAAYTATPFQQILEESYSAALAILGRTADGQTENRLYEIHDDVTRIGAADTNFGLLDGTRDLVELTPDGAGVIFNIPVTVIDFRIVTFYSGVEGSETTCDVLPNNGWITLPDVGYTLVDAALIATIDDASSDTVYCGVGGAGIAPQADITGVDLYRAPADAQFAGGWYVVIRSSAPPDDLWDTYSRFSATLTVNRGTGATENWIYDSLTGQEYNRVLDTNFAPLESTANFAGFNTDRSELVIHIPADVTELQVSTSLAINANDTPVCDLAPDNGTFSLPKDMPVHSAASVTICPSVAQNVPQAAIDSIISLGSGNRHLELRDPELPHHPIYNAMVWQSICSQ